MDNASDPIDAPPCWLDDLEQSEAELAAGLTVPGDEVMRDLHEAIARLEAKQAVGPKRRTVPRG